MLSATDGNCTRLQKNDQLGFTNDDSSSPGNGQTGPLQYEFKTVGRNGVLFDNRGNSSLLKVGDIVTFDPLSLPYQFALQAVYDAGKTTDWNDCNVT